MAEGDSFADSVGCCVNEGEKVWIVGVEAAAAVDVDLE